MNHTDLQIYNAASAAAVRGNRTALARALRAARRRRGFVHSLRFGNETLTHLCWWNASHIGWPIRLRPNGRYL